MSSINYAAIESNKRVSKLLSDPGIWGPIFGSRCPSVTTRRFADLTDVTLADEDTNSILTDNTNMAIQGNMTMQMMQPDD